VKIFVAGMNYRTAPVELRERLAVTPAGLRCSSCRLRAGGDLDELVVLSTCNRVEIYGVAARPLRDLASLFNFVSGGSDDYRDHLYVKEDAQAVRHLFSVSGGLDSMVLGETEITGQVKQAYQAAQALRVTGRVTNRLFQTALQTAKEIRTSTQIGRGATSVGSVAVELTEKIFDQDLSQKTIMIIGAGKMGEACLRHLAKKGARSILVCNRSVDRAEALASELGGRAVPFPERHSGLTEADIVVSSTGSPQIILSRNDLVPVMRERGQRPLFLIDIAVPRDIEAAVQELDQVYLYDIDDLETLVRENVRVREQELERCRAIVEKRTAAFLERLSPAGVAKDSPLSQPGPQPEWQGLPNLACQS
jgi:glutamyl-tRNA reductase